MADLTSSPAPPTYRNLTKEDLAEKRQNNECPKCRHGKGSNPQHCQWCGYDLPERRLWPREESFISELLKRIAKRLNDHFDNETLAKRGVDFYNRVFNDLYDRD